MPDSKICIPSFAELLASVPDAHLMTGPQLAAAIGSAEAVGVFRRLRALEKDEPENTIPNA